MSDSYQEATTAANCVVCKSPIVKREILKYDSEPSFGIKKQQVNSRVEVIGYHCSSCGLEYYKLPEKR